VAYRRYFFTACGNTRLTDLFNSNIQRFRQSILAKNAFHIVKLKRLPFPVKQKRNEVILAWLFLGNTAIHQAAEKHQETQDQE